eukprot:GFUD01019474.1.p1 GENE.GFUD01019474.1~~GFUD01019474.1.p1  ORF type:complete len:787 (+),score=287.80 GFUD01019474.1:221-2362(+)
MSTSELATAKVDCLENSTSNDMKKVFTLLDKKKSSIDASRWSPKKEAAAIPRRSPRKQSKILNFVPTKNKELLRDVFDDSSCSVVSQSDPDSEEPVSPVKRPRSVSVENVLAKKQKLEHEENADSKQKTNSESLELAIYTSAKLQRKKVSPAKNTEEKKRNREQEIPPTPPASKSSSVSPKKKVSLFGKFSDKTEHVEEVKPKFQFNQSKEEKKTIKDHFSFGKDKKSKDEKHSEDNVDKESGLKRNKSVKKSKVFEEEVQIDNKVENEEQLEHIPLHKKSDSKAKKGKEEKKKSKDTGAAEEKKSSANGKEENMKSSSKRKVQSKGVVKPPDSPASKPVFKFSEEDKVIASKPTKTKSSSRKTKELEVGEELTVPSCKTKTKISSVFEVEDDPCVLEIFAKKKKEAEKLADRTKAKTKGRKRGSMAKMAEFSQSITGSQSSLDCSQESQSDDGGSQFKVPTVKKPRKKKEVDSSQNKISKFFKKDTNADKVYKNEELEEEVADYTPSIDELLKLPERSDDGGKTMDEVLDDLDKDIAERKRKHDEEMAKIDTDIAAEKRRQEERRGRLKENALLRNRLEVEITEKVLRRMFKDNKKYLESIWNGEVDSSRHKAFHKSNRTRHALYYTMITDPFTDDQLEWTLDEIGKVWMKNKREQMDNNEYVWKVLLAECFIKFYMDHFGLDKKEAEKKISETPLPKKEDSDEEASSEDEV